MKKDKQLDVDIWLALYRAEWLMTTFTFSNRQRGAIVQLLVHSWGLEASLPDDRNALAKYADEPAEWLFDTPEGRQVLALFPVDNDGRRRNEFYAEKYHEAVANRLDTTARAKAAAEVRWGHRRDPMPEQSTGNAGALLEECPLPSSSSSPSLADSSPALAAALEQWPDVVTWIGDSSARRAVLESFSACVVDKHGSRGLRLGFIPVVNQAIQEHKPDNVERALVDWVATAKAHTLNSLRIYIAGAARNTRAVASIDSAPSRRTAENRPARPTKLADA